MKPELHLFIIWENARYKQDEIIKDIENRMKILEIYEMDWSGKNFSNNLSRFYGTSLPDGSDKEIHCGRGKFLLITVIDENPIYEERFTSKGTKIVNSNIFDLKTKYREMTNGGHKIHSTNNIEEANHDITLLLGMNSEDYLLSLKNKILDKNIIELKKDLIGADGWENPGQMFYALNGCCNYAILRNYESLPEEIYINDHNDIDIICESMEDTAYILNAKKMQNENYRVQHKTNVGDKIAYIDLRYIGDNYYCENLEKNILKNRIWNEKGFYVLDLKDYFYTLMYHALIQKPEFKIDYKAKLEKMEIENVSADTSNEEYINALKIWLKENNYTIVKPNDKSVYFNNEIIKNFNEVIDVDCIFRYKEDEILRLSTENEELKRVNQEILNELAGIKDSRTWKYTKFLRKILKK